MKTTVTKWAMKAAGTGAVALLLATPAFAQSRGDWNRNNNSNRGAQATQTRTENRSREQVNNNSYRSNNAYRSDSQYRGNERFTESRDRGYRDRAAAARLPRPKSQPGAVQDADPHPGVGLRRL